MRWPYKDLVAFLNLFLFLFEHCYNTGMEENFLALAKLAIKPLLRTATFMVINNVRRSYPELSLEDKERMDAKIESFVFGNEFPNLTSNIKRYLADVTTQLENFSKAENLKGSWAQLFEKTEECIFAVKIRLDELLERPSPRTWELFKTEYERRSLDTTVAWMVHKLIRDSHQRSNEADNLMLACGWDLKIFEATQQEISHILIQANFLQIVYQYYIVFPEKIGLDVGNVSISALPKDDKAFLTKMATSAEGVAAVLDKDYRMVKTAFLFKKCGNREHSAKTCGADTELGCCELGAKIYTDLCNDNRQYLDKEEHVKLIVKNLRSAYSHFIWSVVILNDPQQAEFQFNLLHRADIWLQRYGTHKAGKGKRTVSESFIMLDGVGQYGCLLCYRTVMNSAISRAALVFWADPKVKEVECDMQERSRLTARWNSDEGLCSLSRNNCYGAGNVYRVVAAMSEMGMDHVFAVGIRDPSVGNVVLSIDPDLEYPLLLAKENRCVLAWPAHNALTAPAEYNLNEYIDKVHICNGIPRDKGSMYKYSTSKREADPERRSVVVKEINLLRSSGKRSDVQQLINTLSYHSEVLQSLSHRNVVKYLGSKQFPAGPNCSPPTYNIVMEFCSGGSLREWIDEKHAEADKLKWFGQLIEGLAYLHGQGIAHKAISPDNLMFQGPGKAEGCLKIIAVPRIAEIVASVPGERSHVEATAQQKLHVIPFEAPKDADGIVGSKSDIWSAGCVLLVMFLSQLKLSDMETVTNSKGTTLKRHCIPKSVPEGFKTVIQACLAPDYDERPSAEEVLRYKLFNE